MEELGDFVSFDAVTSEGANGAVRQSAHERRREPARGKSKTVLRLGAQWLEPDDYPAVPSCPTAMLNAEIAAFAAYVSPVPAERAARSAAIARLVGVLEGLHGPVRVVYPSAEDSPAPAADGAVLYVYGSFDADLFLPGSDIDAALVLPGTPPANTLERLAAALAAAGVSAPGATQVIARARVPIVKYRDVSTAFEVDVSLNTLTGADAARFIRGAALAEPALRPLVLVLKTALRMRALNTVFTGGLGSFALLCLVASFLRTHPLLQARLMRGEDNLGVLLLEFLELHGRAFNHDAVGVALPPRPDGGFDVVVFDRAARGWQGPSRAGGGSMPSVSIEDPLEPGNDLARGSFAFGAVRQAFEHLFHVLRAAMREYAALVARTRGTRRPADVRAPWPPSILASVVSIDDDTLLHRYYIQHSAA